MAGASDPFSILNKGGQDMRVSQYQKRQTTNRYWRGVVPNANPLNEDDDVDIFPEARSFSSLRTEKMEERMKEFDKKPVGLDLDDIQESQKMQEEEEEARKRVLGRRRQVQKSEVISGKIPENDQPIQTKKNSSKDTEILQEFKKPQARSAQEPIKESVTEVKIEGRAAARARLLQKQREEEQLKASKQQNKQHMVEEMEIEGESEENEDEDEEEEDSEEEEDEDEDEDENVEENRPVYKMMKPVYIPKSERDYQSQIEKDEIEKEEEDKKLKDIAKQQNKMIIMETKKQQIIGEEEGNESDDSRQGLDFPNDDDDLNQAFELEQWKIRELKRIRKDRDEQIAREQEEAEKERRRNMSNEQIVEENLVNINQIKFCMSHHYFTEQITLNKTLYAP